MTITNEVYDTVKVQELEVGDRIEWCGYACEVKAIQDTGLWLYLDLYNEDEDETLDGDDSVPFAANVPVNLIHEVHEN